MNRRGYKIPPPRMPLSVQIFASACLAIFIGWFMGWIAWHVLDFARGLINLIGSIV